MASGGEHEDVDDDASVGKVQLEHIRCGSRRMGSQVKRCRRSDPRADGWGLRWIRRAGRYILEVGGNSGEQGGRSVELRGDSVDLVRAEGTLVPAVGVDGAGTEEPLRSSSINGRAVCTARRGVRERLGE